MTFAETVAAAIKDFEEYGYDSEARLERWLSELRKSAEQATSSKSKLAEMLRDALRAIFHRLVEKGSILGRHPGADRFTLQKVAPRLRTELDRRILASASLIKLNRDEAIEKTLRRFSGWATSIPVGGSEAVSRRETSTDLKKALKSLPFEERRVLIDQGHKLTSSLNAILASDGGAIAGKWRSHWRQAGYNYRTDHKERDGHFFLLRDSWAAKSGLVKPGPDGYSDKITQPGEEVFCRCFYEYVYNLRDLPGDMLTEKGAAELERVRKLTA